MSNHLLPHPPKKKKNKKHSLSELRSFSLPPPPPKKKTHTHTTTTTNKQTNIQMALTALICFPPRTTLRPLLVYKVPSSPTLHTTGLTVFLYFTRSGPAQAKYTHLSSFFLHCFQGKRGRILYSRMFLSAPPSACSGEGADGSPRLVCILYQYCHPTRNHIHFLLPLLKNTTHDRWYRLKAV